MEEIVEEAEKTKPRKEKKKAARPFRFLWILLGFLCLGLGSVGIVVPLLPTVPFYLLTALCFARSSERLDRWFSSTQLYKKYLESYVTHRALSMASKKRITASITVVMAIGFIMSGKIPVLRVIIVIVWACLMVFFFKKIKTLSPEETAAIEAEAKAEAEAKTKAKKEAKSRQEEK